MRRGHAWLVLMGLLAAGCGRAELDGPEAQTAPNLGGTLSDVDGGLRTISTTLGVLAFGDRVEGRLPGRSELIGYEFEAFVGSQPVIELRTAGRDLRPALALYGPRDEQGRWADPQATRAADEQGDLLLQSPELTLAGSYFILIQQRAAPDDAGGDYTLQLGCRGNCGPPSCASLAPCDRVCPLGFVHDEADCRTCTCQQSPECDAATPCPDGQQCGPDGRCARTDPCAACSGQLEPVCGADGQTYGNRCRAGCRDVAVVHDGACTAPPPCRPDGDCPDGLVCREGRCVQPACGCTADYEPVCSTTGLTWRNACELACHDGEALAYAGECRRSGCSGDDRCPHGQACLPVEDPANLEFCARAPHSTGCRRTCRQPEPPAECHCDPAEDRPVCGADNRTYPSACEARCAGVDRFRDGPCGEEACICPPTLEPVCGADGTIYASTCDASCARQTSAADLAPCFLPAQVLLGCRRDQDCQATGCGGAVCAATPTDACPRCSPVQGCHASFGHCGCQAGRCVFSATPDSEACIFELDRQESGAVPRQLPSPGGAG